MVPTALEARYDFLSTAFLLKSGSGVWARTAVTAIKTGPLFRLFLVLPFSCFREGIRVPEQISWGVGAQPSEKRIPSMAPIRRHSYLPLHPHTIDQQSR